jgi:hypothetical protein
MPVKPNPAAHLLPLAIFPIATLRLASLLKRYYGSPAGVVAGLHHGYPIASPLQIGELLLNPTVFPDLPKEDFRMAMLQSNYDAATVDAVILVLYPPPPPSIDFTVWSHLSWQNTGFVVAQGQVAQITYTGGSWFVSPGIGYCGPQGSWQYYAKYGYALPGYPEGGLVGMVGGQPFWVGSQALTPSGASGELYLVCNDDINSWYGSGIQDNNGAITVQISIVN